MVMVADGLDVPEAEFTFATSRSSGPGGQNVNKVSTRVTLLWNVETSPSLSDAQRQRVLQRLPGRINREGILRVVSQRHRTQLANREAVVARFAELVREALEEAPERVAVDVPRGVNERRLEEKKRRGRLKRQRAVDPADEY
jgi:ribosome-associated protein